MSFGGLMLAAGMAEAYNEDVARKKEQAAEILCPHFILHLTPMMN